MSKMIHACTNCNKTYKNRGTFEKHIQKCSPSPMMNNTDIPMNCEDINSDSDSDSDSDDNITNGKGNVEKSYNINMYFNKKDVDVEVTDVDTNEVVEKSTHALKKPLDKPKPSIEEKNEDTIDDETLDEMLRPRVSESYQREINNLKSLIKHMGELNIPIDENDQVTTIAMLRSTNEMLLKQSLKLMEEMEQIAMKNSFLKNNAMMAAFFLEKCKTNEQFFETVKEYEEKDRCKAEAEAETKM